VCCPNPFQPGVVFAGKARSSPKREVPRIGAYLTNVKINWKAFSGTNALAYLAMSSMKKKTVL
jgi:hypothetical protein